MPPASRCRRCSSGPVENYQSRAVLALELNEAYGRLQADPVAWEEELAERALWETTLADGLDDW
jgi:hypothetical protein